MTDAFRDPERAHTTPLTRDNSRVNQESKQRPDVPEPGESSEGAAGTGDTTRPAFEQPGPPGGRRGVPAAASPPAEPPKAHPHPTASLPDQSSAPPQPAVHRPNPSEPHPGSSSQAAAGPGTPQPGTQQPANPPGSFHPAAPQAGGYPHIGQQHLAYQSQPPRPTQSWPQPAPGVPTPTGAQSLGPHAASRGYAAPPGQQEAEQRATGSSKGYLRKTASAAAGRNGEVTPAGWVVRGLGLLAVSLVSGLLWLTLKPGGSGEADQQAQSPAEPRTEHSFQQIRWEESAQSCKGVSTAKIREYFADTECEHLTRALYTTELPDGRRVLTSIVTVLMPDGNSARELEKLTTEENTGNINDLVDEGRPGLDDFPDLHDKAYGSGAQGRLVVIGDSAYFDGNTAKNDPRLGAITTDALKLGRQQDADE